MSLPEPGARPAVPDARPTLLIADDSAMVREVLRAQVAEEFRVVAVAADAAEAIALAAQHRPDAALVDVEMPEGGARVAVPGIAERSPGTCMVVLSADENRRSVLELLAAGAVAYLRKGVPAEEITRILHEALAAGTDAPRS